MTEETLSPRHLLPSLDRLIATELRRLRTRYELSLDELRGLYVSDRLVDALMQPAPPAACAVCVDWPSGLGTLPARLRLSPLSCAILMLALAPELDAKYATLFAYLNDDVARRWATLDLALRIFGGTGDPAARDQMHGVLAPGSQLVGDGLLVPADGSESHRPLLLRGWRVSAPALHHLLGLPGRHAAWLSRLTPDMEDGAMDDVALPKADGPWPVLLVSGADTEVRAGVAARWARKLGRPALLCHLAEIAAEARETALADASLAARLDNAVLAIEIDRTDGGLQLPPRIDVPLVILGDSAHTSSRLTGAILSWRIALDVPPPAARARQWREALARDGLEAPALDVTAVAQRFRLNPLAIRRAARRLALAERTGAPGAHDLLSAAREEAAADLGALARPVRLSADWSDLMLPDGALRQLRDFAGAIRYRNTVFSDWGFESVGGATGSGLAALFAGGSGTGKTMSAGVIARDLGLDLWRIDLAGMVSKYIGETEKNLERLFSAGGVSDAILLFDEADAIFGKRSQVKDSHDRYANIEIAYLLQRLEAHDGVVILATNLSRNLDTAFLRRLHCVIDFPMPDAAARTRLWRRAIPAAAPLAADVDLQRLGHRFELSGGDIRVAALEAGFLAARRNCAIDDAVLDLAVRRQLLKRGQLPPNVLRHDLNGHAAPLPATR